MTASKETEAKAREIFAMYDASGDGKITKKELETVMRGLGQNPSEDEIQTMIKELDADSNGTVEFNEFFSWFGNKRKTPEQEKEELRDSFRIIMNPYDKDGDTKLSREEFKKTLASLDLEVTDEVVDEMIKKADKNGDGFIDLDEFVAVMTS